MCITDFIFPPLNPSEYIPFPGAQTHFEFDFKVSSTRTNMHTHTHNLCNKEFEGQKSHF